MYLYIYMYVGLNRPVVTPCVHYGRPPTRLKLARGRRRHGGGGGGAGVREG